MKRMLMVLMMVFGLSAVFADSYVAFTNQQAIEQYENNEEVRARLDAIVKEDFANSTNSNGFSKQEQKRFTHIVVVNETDILYTVWVYTTESKVFGIGIADADCNPAGGYHYEASSKADPVLVGLNFIKEIVLQVNNIDKNKVVYSAYETQDQNQ